MLERRQKTALQFDADGVAEFATRTPEYLRGRPDGNETDRERQNPEFGHKGAQIGPPVGIGTDHDLFDIRAADILYHAGDHSLRMTWIRACRRERKVSPDA